MASPTSFDLVERSGAPGPLGGVRALEWEAWFGDEVPCAVARQIEDTFDHLQVLIEGLVTTLDHPVVGRYRGVAQPIKFGRTPDPAPFAAPVFGQDAEAVLARTGELPVTCRPPQTARAR